MAGAQVGGPYTEGSVPLHGRRAMRPSAPVRATLTCPYTSRKGAAVRLVIKRRTEVRKLHAETGDKRVAEYLAMLSVYGPRSVL